MMEISIQGGVMTIPSSNYYLILAIQDAKIHCPPRNVTLLLPTYYFKHEPMRSHLTSQPANEGPALFVNIFLGNLFIYFFATNFATNCQPILQPISQTIVNQFCNQLSINVSTNCQSIVNYSATNSKNLTTNNGQNFISLRSCFHYINKNGRNLKVAFYNKQF